MVDGGASHLGPRAGHSGSPGSGAWVGFQRGARGQTGVGAAVLQEAD